MHATTVIRKPMITEKNTHAAEANRYAFEVDKRASKEQIRRAVEELYNVRVVDVNTMRLRDGRVRRTRFGYAFPSVYKKAVVKIHPDDRIELF